MTGSTQPYDRPQGIQLCCNRLSDNVSVRVTIDVAVALSEVWLAISLLTSILMIVEVNMAF